MLRSVLAALLLALVLPASADVLVFQAVRIGKGYVGPVVWGPITWASGTQRDLTGATGSVTVYRTAPVAGVGGVVLFTKTFTPAGTPTDASFSCSTPLCAMSAQVTGTDTALPGTYYAEVTIVQDGVTDALHGSVVIEGR